jgi:hypothetical protein
MKTSALPHRAVQARHVRVGERDPDNTWQPCSISRVDRLTQVEVCDVTEEAIARDPDETSRGRVRRSGAEQREPHSALWNEEARRDRQAMLNSTATQHAALRQAGRARRYLQGCFQKRGGARESVRLKILDRAALHPNQ